MNRRTAVEICDETYRPDTGCLCNTLNVLNGEVRHTDGLHLSFSLVYDESDALIRTFDFGSASIAFHVSTSEGPLGSIAISGFVGCAVKSAPGGKETGQWITVSGRAVKTTESNTVQETYNRDRRNRAPAVRESGRAPSQRPLGCVSDSRA